jgi:hypothetical protein
LILTTALVTDYLLNSRSLAQAGLVLGLHTLVSAPFDRLTPKLTSGWLNLFSSPLLGVLTALWIVLVRLLAAERSPEPRAPAKRREAVLFAAVFVLGLAGASWGNFRHLRGPFSSYNSRLSVTPESILATEPAVADRPLSPERPRKRSRTHPTRSGRC